MTQNICRSVAALISPQKQLRVFLTGATGMLGQNFLRWLKANVTPTPHVIILGRRAVDGYQNIPIEEFSSVILEALPVSEVDLVIHLAAAGVDPSERNADLLNQMNAELPSLMVDLAARFRAKAFVLAGSSSEYQALTSIERLREDTPLEKEKLYGHSKAVGGQRALQTGGLLKMPVGIARCFNIYGAGEAPHRLLPSLITRLSQNEEVPLSLGTQIRDFIYVDDVCGALWNMALGLQNQRLASGSYNVCTGQGCSVAEFAEAVARVGGYDASLLKFGALPMRADDITYLVGDPSLLQKALGWKAHYDLTSGLAASMQEFLKGKVS